MSSTNTFHNLTSLRTFSASTYAPASLGFMAASASAFTASTFFNNNVSLCEPSTVEVVVPTDDINVEDFDGVDFDELEKEVNGLGSTAAKATGEDEFEGRDKSFPLCE